MTPDAHKPTTDVLEKKQAADALLDDDEPTTEELVEMLRESVQQANSGQTRPIDELLRELDDMLAEDDDAG